MESAGETPVKKKLELLGAYERIPNFYCNVSTVRASENEISIMFSQQIDQDSEVLKAMPQALVFMTARHAKRLLKLLETTLKTYEESQGPV